MALSLTARTLKVTIVIPAEQIAGIGVPFVPHLPFVITVNGRRIGGQLNAKTLRRAVAAVAEHGPDNVAVIIQGNLVGDQLEAAGITAQLKGARQPDQPAQLAPAVP